MAKLDSEYGTPERIKVSIEGILRSEKMRSKTLYTTWLVLDSLSELEIPIPDGLKDELTGLVKFVEEHENAHLYGLRSGGSSWKKPN